MLRNARSIRGLLAGALLALVVTIPAGAANAVVNQDGETFTPATIWDVMPKGDGYACEVLPPQPGDIVLGDVQCDHINWGVRGDAFPTRSGFVQHDRWASDVWSWNSREFPDPRLLGTFCDQGGAAFSPECMRERKTGVKVPANAIAMRESDSMPAGDARGLRFTTTVSEDLWARGQWLLSANGRYGVTFQADGNLVAYGPRSKVMWSSGTWGHPQANMRFQKDGNLVIADADGTVLWNSKTFGNAGSTLRVQNDGNVVLYRSNGSAAWYTGWDR